MSHDIESYCKTCGICMTSKDANSKLTDLIHSLPIPDRLWQSIGLDFMGPLLKSNNFDYLLVMIDQLTSQVHLVPTTMTVTTRGIVWLILKEVMRLHGIPESIVSDPLGKGVHSQLGNMHWKVDEHLKYLINFPKRKYSLEI